MLTKEEARIIAQSTIDDLSQKEGRDYVLFEDSVVEKDFAWAFPFNTREYAETGNFMDMVVGIGPIVINRKSKAVLIAPPMPIERFLEQYETEA